MHIINKDVPGYYKDVQTYRIYLVLDCNRHALYAGDRNTWIGLILIAIFIITGYYLFDCR